MALRESQQLPAWWDDNLPITTLMQRRELALYFQTGDHVRAYYSGYPDKENVYYNAQILHHAMPGFFVIRWLTGPKAGLKMLRRSDDLEKIPFQRSCPDSRMLPIRKTTRHLRADHVEAGFP